MAGNGLDNERLVWIFTQMSRIREFEERVKGTFEEYPGVIRGHTHLADGAEASIVGSIAADRSATFISSWPTMAANGKTGGIVSFLLDFSGKANIGVRVLEGPGAV